VPSQRTIAGGIQRECVEKYNNAAKLFNAKLSSKIDSLNTNLSDSKMVYLDVYNPLLDLIQKPAKYGKLKYPNFFLNFKFFFISTCFNIFLIIIIYNIMQVLRLQIKGAVVLGI
jgi:hypothetical protein